MIEKGNEDPFFWNFLDNEQFWYLGIVDKGCLQTRKGTFVKIDFGSNGKMIENGSEQDQNGGKIEENSDFQTFFSNTLVEKLQ